MQHKSLRVLISSLSSKDKDERRIAAERLGELGDPRAIKPLIEASGRGGGERAKHAAVQALARIGKPSIQPLVNTLLQDTTSVFRRASAAEAIGLTGSRRGVRPLLRTMNDSSVDVRLHTVVVLARLKDRRAIPHLLRALSDESGGVRLQAAAALSILRIKKAVEPLVKALGDERGT